MPALLGTHFIYSHVLYLKSKTLNWGRLQCIQADPSGQPLAFAVVDFVSSLMSHIVLCQFPHIPPPRVTRSSYILIDTVIAEGLIMFSGVGAAEGRAVPAAAADLRGEAPAARAHRLRVEADRARGRSQPRHLLGVVRGWHLRADALRAPRAHARLRRPDAGAAQGALRHTGRRPFNRVSLPEIVPKIIPGHRKIGTFSVLLGAYSLKLNKSFPPAISFPCISLHELGGNMIVGTGGRFFVNTFGMKIGY